MKDLAGRIAVITGGGTGMGRELARQLVAEGCNVAMCDVSAASAMAETKRLCEVERLPQGLRITTHVADVANEDEVKRFADEVAKQHDTDKIHLLFNNAGIGGGGSMIVHGRDEWERTFNVCWFGVYYSTRAFLPMLLKADEGHIVNTSSVNGFWASVGPSVPHTAYSAAKFAVKGFSEALQTDLRMNAPHIKCSVVMPGHIGTSIVSNSRKIQSGNESDTMNAKEIAQMRARVASMGIDVSKLSDDDIAKMAAERARSFREEAPTSAAQAAKIILDGVKAERWRILVGRDAEKIDQRVREAPERAYDLDFFREFRQGGRLEGRNLTFRGRRNLAPPAAFLLLRMPVTAVEAPWPDVDVRRRWLIGAAGLVLAAPAFAARPTEKEGRARRHGDRRPDARARRAGARPADLRGRHPAAGPGRGFRPCGVHPDGRDHARLHPRLSREVGGGAGLPALQEGRPHGRAGRGAADPARRRPSAHRAHPQGGAALVGQQGGAHGDGRGHEGIDHALSPACLARETPDIFPTLRSLVTPAEFDEHGRGLRKLENAKFGGDGFEKMAKRVEQLEKRIGIHDLAQFTPKT